MRGVAVMGAVLKESAQQLMDQPAEYSLAVARREGVGLWQARGNAWLKALVHELRNCTTDPRLLDAKFSRHGDAALRQAAPGAAEVKKSQGGAEPELALVDDDTIEREISMSRLTLAMMDKASWEFTDLRMRMQALEAVDDLPPHDLLRGQTVARLALDAWFDAGLTISVWHMLQNTLHEEFGQLLCEAYHDTNDWLVAQGVLADVDLRPFIRRSAATRIEAAKVLESMWANSSGAPGAGSAAGPGDAGSTRGALAGSESTRGLAPASPARNQAEEVLAQLQRVLKREVPGFAGAAAGGARQVMSPHMRTTPAALSERLQAVINRAQNAVQQPFGGAAAAGAPGADFPVITAPEPSLDEVRVRSQALKQELKQAAETQAERATIEVVALLFQSILTDERLPASVRVWFARLQMPVLRVAVSEPDFFAETDHPARQLIDRMGACVMGFSASSSGEDVGEALDREIKRVVQVVEAYPDTGRRVFQTVLTEFEKFLGHYFAQENSVSRKGVSLAQQVEQRETLAIQYTIELRKMLSEVPVQDGVREFLFHVWADVLAVAAVRSGPQSDATKAMKRAAADLIWSAGAKVSREERAAVIQRLPALLKALRGGMADAGLPLAKQDEQLRALNNSLSAAFTAKSAAIPRERMDELMEQLEALEDMLPDGDDAMINEALISDLSGHETEDLEVVADGGSPPTAPMLAWAKELQLGSWYMLDYRGRNEPVQLAWRGMRHQLILLVSPQGRGVLFKLNRLAGFLQAGLLVPAQDEALTVRATRDALAKIDMDPSRLFQ